ncbi:hypothetical protein GJ629_06180 [Halapricum sp. CBA1109]|uniref:hypothetical protein n=1 Tax=Halapricum sp. CBA1109 TaxID=2668068 RepID=UPI0012F9F749|nr:hypothetical protein [Halapricum sp. CBA1109]MUV89534.1 hypothetical protein [Halapricum sp. CBA1109]
MAVEGVGDGDATRVRFAAGSDSTVTASWAAAVAGLSASPSDSTVAASTSPSWSATNCGRRL